MMLPWKDPAAGCSDLADELADEECRKAAGKAMRLLLQQDRTGKRLRECLYRAGFSEKAVEYAMQYVIQFGYIDDLRYARNYISYHKESYSRKEMQYKLMDRGITAEQIAEAFREYGTEDEHKALRRQLQKRLRGNTLSYMDIPARNKVMAYLVRKGYAIPAVRSVMKEWMDGEKDSQGE